MIQVIATIELKPGILEEFVPILKANVPNVKAEDGCLAYDPFVDFDSGLPVQGEIRENAVTLVEAWTSVDGKLYLKYNIEVRGRWRKDPKSNIETAKKNWTKLRPGS